MNVINLRERTHGVRGSKSQLPERADVDTSELAFWMADLQSKAKDEVFKAVLMLDLAAQHAHEIAKKIQNPASRQVFDAHVASIEQLLQIARDMAVRL